MRSHIIRTEILGICIAALLASLSVWAESLTVTSVSGDAKATPLVGPAVALRQGDSINTGGVIRTGRDGRVKAQFDTRNRLEIFPESTVELAGGKRKRRQPIGTRLLLKSGRVRSVLDDWPAHRTYEVVSSVGTFSVQGTEFDVAAKLGPAGEFVGGTNVVRGEVGYACSEVTVPSVTAGGGLSITRIVGLDGVFIELTTAGLEITIEVAGSHRISVAANTTVRIAIAVGHQKRFYALGLVEGSAIVGKRTLTPVDGVVFAAGDRVLPNGGGQAFMDAVQVESTAHAQSLLPDLTGEQIAMLEKTRLSGSSAITNSAIGASVLPQFHPPFVPERPIGMPLSASGTP